MLEGQGVSKAQLQAELENLKQSVIDPKLGIWGPNSLVWEINRHSTVMFGAGRANVLQLLHPWVANGIDQHSATQSDPFGRLRRTFLNVFAMTFGDLEQVLDAAVRVYKVHNAIKGELVENSGRFDKGSAYYANHSGALMWVHATLMETSVRMYELFQHPLSAREKNQFYTESKLFGHLFGIPQDTYPADWEGFIEYSEAMWRSDCLVAGNVAKEMVAMVFSLRWWLQPALDLHRFHTAMLLPANLNLALGFAQQSQENQRRFDRQVANIKRGLRYAPRHIKYLSPYLEALARIEGKRKAPVLTRGMNKLLLGRSELVI